MKPLQVLFFVTVVDVLGFGILVPLVPYMGERFGLPPALITPILGSYSLCQLIAAPLWGRLSDRYGRRPVLIASLAGACVSYLILGLAENAAWLLVSRILAGLMAGNLAAAFAYAADFSAPEHRARALGMVGAAIGIGFMLGPAIGGVLAGADPATADFMRPAAVSMALTVVAIALVRFVLPESHAAEHGARRRDAREASGPLTLLAARPALRALALAALCVTFAQAVLESIFAIWALHRYGFGPRTVGIVLFGLAFVAVLTQGVLVRVLAPRFGEARLAVVGVLAFAAGLLVVAFGPSLPVTLAGFAACGFGAGAFAPSASALASRQAGVSERGAVMGTYQASGSLARVVGPFVSGAIYASWGSGAPFWFSACVALPAVWLIWRAQQVRAAPVAA